MRKCDICSTVIPIGTDRCPNCGFQYKPERKLDGQRKKYMSQFQPHPSPLDNKKKKVTIHYKDKKSFSTGRFVGIIIPIIIMLIGIGVFGFVKARDYFMNTGFLDLKPYTDYIEMYPRPQNEVDDYYFLLEWMYDMYGNGHIQEEYYANDAVVDCAEIQTRLLVDGVDFHYSVSKENKNSEYWQESFKTTFYNDGQKEIEALAMLADIDFESLYTLYKDAPYNNMKYWIEDGWFYINKTVNKTEVVYVRDLY